MTMKSAVLRVMTELSQPRDRMCPAERARIGHAWENNKQHKENCITEMVACCIDLAEKYSLTLDGSVVGAEECTTRVFLYSRQKTTRVFLYSRQKMG